MREVNKGGHFFGAEHTQSRYRTAFFPPTISDWRNYESWREAGSPTAFDAAEASSPSVWRLHGPALEAERPRGAHGLVTRRKAEGARRRTFERDPADERLLAERQERATPPLRSSAVERPQST